MIDRAMDISVQIGWDTITDLELAHTFIQQKGLENEFVGFLLGIKKQDEEWQEDQKEGTIFQNGETEDCC